MRDTPEQEYAEGRLRPRILIAIGAIVSALAFTACSSQPGYCSAKDEAQQSFEQLTSTDVIQDGTDALKERFQAFSSDAESLVAAAEDEFQTEIDALRSSLLQMEGVVEGVGEDAAAAAPLVAPAIEDLQTSTQDLFEAVDQTCE